MLRAVFSILCLALPVLCRAAVPTPELHAAVKAGTVEIVLHKVENPALQYEKPLPLELIPFVERNDRFQSIGTAFLLEQGVYVTAAHVLLVGLDSEMGPPSIRDAGGKVHAVRRIRKFSLQEDFAVFDVEGDAGGKPLPTADTPVIGQPVFAVGNALGEGVILRDGLLTSETPEAQDGRWKWLRFSAPASPGNSGGPLLDANGAVIGVVTAKSPNENLNFALPLSRVRSASASAGEIDLRQSFQLPNFRAQRVSRFEARIPLPASLADFTRQFKQAVLANFVANRKALLDEQKDQVFPRGNSDRLLATLEKSVKPVILKQADDDSWTLDAGSDAEDDELADGGRVEVTSGPGVALFSANARDVAGALALRQDPRKLMDRLLPALKLKRVVGPQAIRITSLGVPAARSVHVDRFGRQWEQSRWSLGYMNTQIIVLALPAPDGVAGLMRVATGLDLEVGTEQLHYFADQFNAGMGGSLPQWQQFQSERKTGRGADGEVRVPLKPGDPIELLVSGAQLKVPAGLLKLTDDSRLSVFPSFWTGASSLHVGFGGFLLRESEAKSSSYVGVYRQPKPGARAGKTVADRWADMSARRGDFVTDPHHDNEFRNYWTRFVIGEPDAGFLHEALLNVGRTDLLPRELQAYREQLTQGLEFRRETH